MPIITAAVPTQLKNMHQHRPCRAQTKHRAISELVGAPSAAAAPPPHPAPTNVQRPKLAAAQCTRHNMSSKRGSIGECTASATQSHPDLPGRPSRHSGPFSGAPQGSRRQCRGAPPGSTCHNVRGCDESAAYMLRACRCGCYMCYGPALPLKHTALTKALSLRPRRRYPAAPSDKTRSRAGPPTLASSWCSCRRPGSAAPAPAA